MTLKHWQTLAINRYERMRELLLDRDEANEAIKLVEMARLQAEQRYGELEIVTAELLAVLREVLRVVESPKSTVSMPHTVRRIKKAILKAKSFEERKEES